MLIPLTRTLLQLVCFAVECDQVRLQLDPLLALVGQRLDALLQLIAALHQHGNATRFVVRIKQRPAHVAQVTHDVDQRDAVQAGRQFVEQVRRFGVVECAEFLQFAQPDREHVVEGGFIDAGQQVTQQRNRHVRSVRRLHHQVFFFVGQAQAIQMPQDPQRSVCGVDIQRPAGTPPVHRWQVATTTLRRETVEHAADELHQCRLAGLVGTEHDGHTMGQSLQIELGPDTESVHM